MLVLESSYKGAPSYQINGHFQTLIPGLFRKIDSVPYARERINLADGDFIDLDWLAKSSDQLLILSHGLEGNSTRQYMLGPAKHFHNKGWDILSWNCRSCSEELNRKFRLYYHGDINDFESVINHVLSLKKYKRIVLVGFSMGGSILSKYLGCKGNNVPSEILGGLSFSAPCDLRASIKAVEKKSNWIYNYYFKKMLKEKITAKANQFPGKLDINQLDTHKDWESFDQQFSCPLNGFKNVEDFYEQGSCKNFFHLVKTPLLIVNALNDPIIPNTCINYEQLKRHKYIDVEYPKSGGHVGFTQHKLEFSWMETKIEEFLVEQTGPFA